MGGCCAESPPLTPARPAQQPHSLAWSAAAAEPSPLGSPRTGTSPRRGQACRPPAVAVPASAGPIHPTAVSLVPMTPGSEIDAVAREAAHERLHTLTLTRAASAAAATAEAAAHVQQAEIGAKQAAGVQPASSPAVDAASALQRSMSRPQLLKQKTGFDPAAVQQALNLEKHETKRGAAGRASKQVLTRMLSMNVAKLTTAQTMDLLLDLDKDADEDDMDSSGDEGDATLPGQLKQPYTRPPPPLLTQKDV